MVIDEQALSELDAEQLREVTQWVFRTNVTGDFGIVTEDFGPS